MDSSKLNLEVWRNLQIQKKTNIVWLWTENNFSLEKSPNSTFEFGKIPAFGKKTEKISEFGVFSKLNLWVWRLLRKKNRENIMNLSLEETPSSKTKQKNNWAWSKLQTQPLSSELPPNSKKICVLPQRVQLQNAFYPQKKGRNASCKIEFGGNSKLIVWVWRKLQTHFFSSLSPEFGDFSKLKGWVWRNLQTQIIFFVFSWVWRVFSKLKGWVWLFSSFFSWVWRFLQTQRLSLELFSLFFLEFGVFSKLRIFSCFPLRLEISPNSKVEFGDVSLRRKMFCL